MTKNNHKKLKVVLVSSSSSSSSSSQAVVTSINSSSNSLIEKDHHHHHHLEPSKVSLNTADTSSSDSNKSSSRGGGGGITTEEDEEEDHHIHCQLPLHLPEIEEDDHHHQQEEQQMVVVTKLSTTSTSSSSPFTTSSTKAIDKQQQPKQQIQQRTTVGKKSTNSSTNSSKESSSNNIEDYRSSSENNSNNTTNKEGKSNNNKLKRRLRYKDRTLAVGSMDTLSTSDISRSMNQEEFMELQLQRQNEQEEEEEEKQDVGGGGITGDGDGDGDDHSEEYQDAMMERNFSQDSSISSATERVVTNTKNIIKTSIATKTSKKKKLIKRKMKPAKGVAAAATMECKEQAVSGLQDSTSISKRKKKRPPSPRIHKQSSSENKQVDREQAQSQAQTTTSSSSSSSKRNDNNVEVKQPKPKREQPNLLGSYPDCSEFFSTEMEEARDSTKQLRSRHEQLTRMGLVGRSLESIQSFQSNDSRFVGNDILFDDDHSTCGGCWKIVREHISYARDMISPFFVISLVVMTTWSIVCAWGAEQLALMAAVNIDGDRMSDDDSFIGRTVTSIKLLDWIDNTRTSISVLGTLFTFSLVFRFNQCYARWWEGRVIWENLITTSLSFAQRSYFWITNKELADRLGRFIIVFPYACKAQLRNKSLGDPEESGRDLIERGRLTEEELEDMEAHPCWQPVYVLDVMRTIVAEAVMHDDDSVIYRLKHPIYKELFKFLEDSISELGKYSGDAVRVRSAGLPQSYDAMHFMFFYMYFTLAPISWAPSMGYALPFLIFFLVIIILALISMGTSLVDPFGTDVVDLPIDLFCITIELQVREIKIRNINNRKIKHHFAINSSTDPKKADRMPTIPSHMKYSSRINMD